MSDSSAAVIAFHYRRTHERALALVAELSDEQAAWRPTPGAHSIGFILWHLGRWADHLQATVPTMTAELGGRLGEGRQIWEAEGLASAWGLTPASLGHAETGMLMGDDDAATLPLPDRAVLLDYARRAFAAADRAVGAIDDRQAVQPQAGNPDRTVASAVLTHLTHDNRHLGEIEYLRGLQGLRGTATR
jgi:DinB family protein